MGHQQTTPKHHQASIARSQSGVALISMLLIFSLVVILVAAASKRDSLMIRRISLQLAHSGAMHHVLTGEILARQRLAEDWQAQPQGDDSSDHLNEDWALPQTLPVEGGQVSVRIRDLHSCFNLNNLIAITNTAGSDEDPQDTNNAAAGAGQVNTAYLNRLKRLLDELALDTDKDEWVNQLLDWLDTDTQALGGGIEEPPAGHLANANRALEHISELSIFIQLSEIQKTALYQQLCVLPLNATGKASSINPNTASELMLSSWEKGLIGAAVIAGREESELGYIDNKAFLSHKSSAGTPLKAGDFDVRSHYFEAIIQADFATQSRYLISRLYRDPNNGQIITLARHFGYNSGHNQNRERPTRHATEQ